MDAAIAAKQAYETREMKKLSCETGSKHPNTTQIAAHTDQIVGQTETEHAKLDAAVHSAFVPVNHVIKITEQ